MDLGCLFLRGEPTIAVVDVGVTAKAIAYVVLRFRRLEVTGGHNLSLILILNHSKNSFV